MDSFLQNGVLEKVSNHLTLIPYPWLYPRSLGPPHQVLILKTSSVLMATF